MPSSLQEMPNFQKDMIDAAILSAEKPINTADVEQTTGAYNAGIITTNNEYKQWVRSKDSMLIFFLLMISLFVCRIC